MVKETSFFPYTLKSTIITCVITLLNRESLAVKYEPQAIKFVTENKVIVDALGKVNEMGVVKIETANDGESKLWQIRYSIPLYGTNGKRGFAKIYANYPSKDKSPEFYLESFQLK
jgi:hypothetical protein